MGWKRVRRCKECGRIYERGIPYICKKCGAEIGRPTTALVQAPTTLHIRMSARLLIPIIDQKLREEEKTIE